MSLEKALADNTAALNANSELLRQNLEILQGEVGAAPAPEPTKKTPKKEAPAKKTPAKKEAPVQVELPDLDEDDDDDAPKVVHTDISSHVRNVYASAGDDLAEKKAAFAKLLKKWGVAKVSLIPEEDLPGALKDVQSL